MELVQPEMISCSLRSVDKEVQRPDILSHAPPLKAVEIEVVLTKTSFPASRKMLNLHQASKRKVQKGSDPIHNRP
ncbi:hypothetical protein Dimus_014915 [Dionaea muscipula]